MADQFPIPTAWVARLAEMQWVVHRPVLADGVLLIRVRQDMFRVRATDGAVLGRTEIDPDRGRGIVCVGYRDCAIVDVGDAGKGKSSLVAVGRDGELRWQRPLQMQLMSDTGTLAGDELLVCGHKAGTGNFVLSIDAGSGDLRSRTALPNGGAPSTALRWGTDAVLIASPVGGPGLYAVVEGGKAAVLDDRRVQRLIGSADRALVAARPEDDRYELGLYAPGEPAPRWRAPAPGFACAVDGDRVACLVDEGGPRAALRSASDGRVLWRAAAPMERTPSTATLAGGLVLFGAGTRVWIYRREEGALVGESRELGTAAIADGGRLYIGGEGLVAAADLALI